MRTVARVGVLMLACVALALAVAAGSSVFRPQPPRPTAVPPPPAPTREGPPAVQGHPVPSPAGSTGAEARIGTRTVTVRITPDRQGRDVRNEVAVDVTDQGRPADASVGYDLTMPFHQMPPDAGQTQRDGDGRRRLPPAIRFDMAGDWKLELQVDGRWTAYWIAVDPNGRIAFQEP